MKRFTMILLTACTAGMLQAQVNGDEAAAFAGVAAQTAKTNSEAMAALVKTAGTLSERDMDFMNEAAQGDMMEVKLAELAQKNGSSAAVKQLAQQMITDHTASGRELRSLAEKKGVTLPATISAKQQKAYDKMAKMTGTDFDKTYAKCMAKDHKMDICAYKKEAKKGSDTDVTAFASRTVPTLENHEALAKSTCKSIKEKK